MVTNINYVRKDTQNLYGVSRDQRSYIRSDDGGDTWWSISDQEYNTEMEDVSEVVHHTKLPFNVYSEQTIQTLSPVYNGYSIGGR